MTGNGFRGSPSQTTACMLLASCLAWTVVGCGDSTPKTIPVHGTVTWQGKPLTNGNVTFEPVSSDIGSPLRPARGALGNDGTYRLSTFRTHDGAQPGKYAVVITSYAVGAPSIDAIAPAPAAAIPKIYSRADTSGLSATIPAHAEGELEINFDLPLKRGASISP